MFLNAVSNGVWQDEKKIVVSGVAGTTTTTTMPEPQQQQQQQQQQWHAKKHSSMVHCFSLTRQWICQNQRHLIFRLGSMGRSLLALR